MLDCPALQLVKRLLPFIFSKIQTFEWFIGTPTLQSLALNQNPWSWRFKAILIPQLCPHKLYRHDLVDFSMLEITVNHPLTIWGPKRVQFSSGEPEKQLFLPHLYWWKIVNQKLFETNLRKHLPWFLYVAKFAVFNSYKSPGWKIREMVGFWLIQQ